MLITRLGKLKKMAEVDLTKVNKAEGLIASAEGQIFSAIFGRDILITSLLLLETHKVSPNHQMLKLIRNNLLLLTRNQGKKVDWQTEEEPGKIEHENRAGPANQKILAKLKRHGWPVKNSAGQLYLRYWGAIDTTPLFVATVAEYILVENDWKFFEEISASLKAALSWMENYGDLDNDTFIEFSAKNRKALLNHGWKDSSNSILTPEGKHPTEPIALVEVQGYSFWAYTLASKLFKKAGRVKFSQKLQAKAEKLARKLNQSFWMKEENFFAYALNGNKVQLKDIVSNVGHLLITGILEKEKAKIVVKRLMQPDMFTRYGIRTLSVTSPHFRFSENNLKIQEQAYHNGTVWPHDNAIIEIGLKKYGFHKEAQILRNTTLSAIAQLGNVELYQVSPDGLRLVPYERAAYPQTWAIASTLLWITKERQIVERFRKLNYTLQKAANFPIVKEIRKGASKLNRKLNHKKPEKQ